MISDMDKVFRRILNDEDIFWTQKEIFNKEEWLSLKEKFRNGNMDEFEKVIQEKIKDYDQKITQTNNNKEREKFQKAKTLCQSLIKAISNKPNLLNNLFEYLDSFGLVKSNLPSPSSMDDYGKVIERYEISIVELYFLDKINRENNMYTKNALKKLLEYVKELYQSNQSPLEIAYFIRKLNSLTTLWEVLNG
uniref:Uncharacterized protein n=1 Tax=candidate division WOR-3 bacterium TaxID=2052148 RepID=A0A7C3N7J8_UNCW3